MLPDPRNVAFYPNWQAGHERRVHVSRSRCNIRELLRLPSPHSNRHATQLQREADANVPWNHAIKMLNMATYRPQSRGNCSLPEIVEIASNTLGSIVSEMNRTEPSTNATFAPPG